MTGRSTARQRRPAHNRVGRTSPSAAEAVSDTMGRPTGSLTRQLRVAPYSLGTIAALPPVAACEAGIIRHLPELPIPPLDANLVNASGEAYATGLREASGALKGILVRP